MISPRVLAAACILTFAAQSGLAQSASENQVAAKTDWSVFEEAQPRECWAVSAPKESIITEDGRVVEARRSQILLMAFYRPGAEVAGQITFTGGYPFRSGSMVNLNIDGTEFELFTEGEWAWPASTSEDQRIMAALKRGTSAVVTGISGLGKTTKDTFSLLGFTAAVEEAASRCG